MTKTRDKKRQSPISYRPPEHLRAEFERRVKESDLSINAFLTEAWHGRNRHRPSETKLLARLLAECTVFADRERRMPPVEPSSDQASRSDEIKTLLTEIRSALFLLMGRKP
tara:strand:- start:10676 stop:11008 length:333 start_codon:yes stop_codon:yes gene_type:complete